MAGRGTGSRRGSRRAKALAGIALTGAAQALAALAVSSMVASPLAAQSLPSDAMLSRTFAERGPNMLLGAPLKALKVATLDLPPALGSGLGFTLPEPPAVPPPGEDSYSYPPALVLAAPEPAVAAAPPADDPAGRAEAEAEAETPTVFGPTPPARNVYLELALDSLLSLPNIDDEAVASDDEGQGLFGPDISGADVDPSVAARRAADAGGIGSDAVFPMLPDDQGWADLGSDPEADGDGAPLYRDPTVVFGTDPNTFPAQAFEHATDGLPTRLVPVPVSAPTDRARDAALLGGGTLQGGLAGPTFAERLGLEGPARARAEKCLAEAIYFESRGEPKRGQIAVAQVVINRVFSGYYPNDVCKTVYQNAHRHLACQFTFACDDVKDVVREPDMWVQAKQISADMLDGKLWLDSVGRATHYHAYWVHPSWVREMRKLDRIGVHTFYRPKRWNG